MGWVHWISVIGCDKLSVQSVENNYIRSLGKLGGEVGNAHRATTTVR